MNLKAGLWQQQTLKLTMTQELSQAIALLQYSAGELIAFLENKALENPLMKIESSNIQPMNPLRDRNRKKHRKVENNWIEQIADKPYSLEEQLLSQINIKQLSKVQLSILRRLIQNLDENGYFTGDLDELAQSLNVNIELVEDGLAILQTLEPAGIGARSLQECLLIQIYYQDPSNELAQKILTDFFVPFAEKKWKEIAKELGVSLKEIQQVFDEIQKLNPKPGSILGKPATTYITPDAIVEHTMEGLTVRMYDDLLPKITFNESYYTKFKDQDQQVSQFIHEKYQDYHWILRSIEQRKETLMKVVAKIIEKQPLFFQKGPSFLAPMTMKEVAEELEIHESTVSRAVREKYIQTPMGTYPLKSFFTSTIQTTSEDQNTSSAHVKKTIRDLIDNEDKKKPLSDQEIVETLKTAEGLVVSRRTIAKYRDQLGIPASSKRKRFD